MKRSVMKRGMSSIIATLLIIMLTLVVVGILWIVVKNLIFGQTEITGVQKDFFTENIGVSSVKVTEPLVSLSLERVGGKMKAKDIGGKEEVIEVIETDIISVVDLSGSMTQCIGVSQTCCINTLDGTSYDTGLDICYGADTSEGNDCKLICKGNLYLLSGNNNGNFNSYVWNGAGWTSDSTIRNNLIDLGSNSAPSVFRKDGNLNLITGDSLGLYYGYTWDETQWEVNLTINASIPSVLGYSRPAAFNISNNWYMISGESTGNFKGFNWNGSQWISNSIINSSLPDIGSFSSPFVFYKDSSLYLISGENSGRFYGYVWNGANWIRNSTINASLPDIGGNSTPSVFYKDSSWYLISGENGGRFYGYVWNGTNWRTNTTINASLPDAGSNSMPVILYKNSIWTDRLTPTKQANKELINSILSQSEDSRIGFVAYSTDVINSFSLDLTSNGNILNNTIDSWQPSSSTCICCGINEAADRLDSQSDDETSKKIIVMSDGEANYECSQQNTGDSLQDAIQASCDAKALLENIVVHAIGAGEGVNEATLTSISTCGGGNYYSAINTSELIEIYRQVAEAIKRTYTSTSNFNYLFIKFYNSTTTYTEKITDIPDVLIVRNYQFDLTGKLEGEIIKIEIYPVVVTESGREVVGPLFDFWVKP